MPNYNGVWSLSTQYQNAGAWPLPPLVGDLALFTKGTNSQTGIVYVTITTTGSEADWGDLPSPSIYTAGMSSLTRGVYAAGKSSGNANVTTMESVEMRSLGVSADFGEATTAAAKGDSGCSNSTRGIFADISTMSYITIASAGNAIDFGDYSDPRRLAGGMCSSTRAVWGGGMDASTNARLNVIDYVTIATTGNATDFGDLTQVQSDLAGLSSSTRGAVAGGASSGYTNVIQYITIASTGNASDFGDLSQSKQYNSGTGNATRGIIAIGEAATNALQYITYASTGNSTNFGSLDNGLGRGAVSNAHGGLA